MSEIRDIGWLVTEKVYSRVNDLIQDSGEFDRDNQLSSKWRGSIELVQMRVQFSILQYS